VLTYAGLLGRDDELLEAMRKDLYRNEPPEGTNERKPRRAR